VTSRDRIVILVVAAAVALGAFWMLALKPKRQEASKLGKQLSTERQRLDTAKSDLQSGQAARSQFSLNYATVARLGKAVPIDDDVPSLVYQLDTTAESSGVDFRSVKLTSGGGTPGASSTTSGNATAAASDQAGGGQDKQQGDKSAQQGGDQAKPADGATETKPAQATQAATAALPPGAVVGPAGLSTMPFSFTFEGSFFRLSDFLTRIERYITPRRQAVDVRGRLLLVNGISLTAAQTGFPKMKASISATAYLLPSGQGLFNGASPQGPDQPATAQPVSGSNPASPAAPATVKAP
jgi:type II secretory pathway pseudopilin PulG